MITNHEIQEKEDINIYESLNKKGVLDNIKAYLRTSLAQSIKGEKAKAENSSSKIQCAKDLQINQNINNNLIRKAINRGDFERIKLYKVICSLFKDFFRKADLSYTFSVFTAECGFQDLLTEEELSKTLNITYTNLENIGEENFMAFIVKQLLNAKERNSVSTQASDSDFSSFAEAMEFSRFKGLSTAKSIEAKFREVDEKYFKLTLLENGNNLNDKANPNLNLNYSNLFDHLMPAKAIEEKILKYQREAEAKFKTDLDREIVRMKEIEISNIRIEENKKYLKKLEEVRNEYEEEYTQRYENLRKREADFSLKIANKEKELELSQYETRQKYLNQIESLKLKQEELKIKYENDLNLLSIKQEKINIKEKDLENLRENANRKVLEEIESFKIEFLKNFDADKAELHKQRLKVQEIEYKSNLRNERFENLEKENKEIIEEDQKLKNEIKKLEENNKELKCEIQALREEIKILASNEKRNYDQVNIKSAESESLRTENKILRENIQSLKQMNEERKNDQGAIIEDLKVQIKENTKQFIKVKEDLENENVSLRREVSDLKEKMKLNEKMVKNNEKINKEAENFVDDLYFTNNVKFQQQLVNAQRDIRKPIANYEYNLDYLNINKYNREALNYNNYLKDPNKEGIKAFDQFYKLEKEAEELKEEFKNTFINKTKSNENNNLSPIFNEYNLWNLQNKEAQTLTNNLEKSIVNSLFEKLKDSNLINNLNSKSNNYNDNCDSIEDRKKNRDSFNLKNKSLNNNSNSHNNKKNNEDFNPVKKYEKDEFINMDKLHETPVFNKDSQNVYSNFKKELNNYDNNKNHNSYVETSDFNYENNKNKSNNHNINTTDIQRNKEIEKLQNELEKIKNSHSQNIQINPKQHSRNNSKSNNNINIIDNYNTNNNQDQNILNNNNHNKSNRESDYNEFSVGNITSSYDWELESNRKDKKDENKFNMNNSNNNNLISKLENKNANPVNKNTLNSNNISSTTKSVKLKDLKDKGNSVSIYNSNPIENSMKKISSIKEESDEQEKENVSSFDDNGKNKISEVKADSKKKEIYFNSEYNKGLKNNNNNLNNLSNQKQNKIKNNTTYTNSNQKTPVNNKNTSYFNNITNKSNSYGDFDNTENLEGLNLKNSFNNKFSNVNFDLDQKENDEEIKSENPSENYGDDFIEDVDNIDNKNHKISFDLDAIKNVSNNFTGTNISYLVKDNVKNNSKSREKDGNKNNHQYNNNNKNNYTNNISNSTDVKYEKFYQSKNSNDDGGIEENISVNDSSKRDKHIHSAKSLTIDEDSYLRHNKDNNAASNEYKYNFSENMIKSNIEDSNNNFNDYYASKDFAGSNTLKNIINTKAADNSNREINNLNKLYESRNSEIREEILDEDDAYEPINYD